MRLTELTAQSKVAVLEEFVKANSLTVNFDGDKRSPKVKERIYNDIVKAMASRQTTTPGTGQAPRTRPVNVSDPIAMPSLDLGGLSADSPLGDLRKFIETHGLDVAKNVGGRGRRTKEEMFAEIKAAMERGHTDDEDAIDEAPPDIREMTIVCSGGRRVSVRSQLEVDVKRLGESADLGRAMAALLESSFEGGRLNARARDFIIDEPSSRGLAHLVGLTTRQLAGAMSKERAIENEFAAHGTPEDKECLDYVLHQRAGTSDVRFANGIRDEYRMQEAFDDFCSAPEAIAVGLEREEVLALRLYTTAACAYSSEQTRAPHPP